MSTNATALRLPKGSGTSYGLALSGLSHFAIELSHNFLPVLYPLLIVSMDLSFQQIGTIALIIGLLTSLPQPFLGFLSDRFGSYLVAGLSIMWLGILMSMTGLVSNYWILALLVGLASLGSSAYHPAGAVMAAANSKERRGVSMSIFSVGGNFGSALSPILVAALIPWLGLNAALGVLPVALIVSFLLIRQTKVNAASGSSVRQPSHKQSIAKQPDTNQDASTNVVSETIKAAPVLWAGLILLTVASMARSWFQVSLMTYLPLWIESGGGSLTQASQMLSVFAFSIGAGSMFGGTASDRVGGWIIVLLSFAVMGPAYWIFLNSTGFGQYTTLIQFIALAVIGFSIGNTFPTLVLMAQDCWSQRAAVASGLIMGIGWAPGGLGASYTGYVADTSSLGAGLQLLLIPPIVGVVCLVLVKIFNRTSQSSMV